MMLPVINPAPSEARYAITSATSVGVAIRCPDEWACVAMERFTQPVSVMGGYTTLAVTP
jgi:hypothetical protein